MINIRFKYFIDSIILLNKQCISDINGYRKEPGDTANT